MRNNYVGVWDASVRARIVENRTWPMDPNGVAVTEDGAVIAMTGYAQEAGSDRTPRLLLLEARTLSPIGAPLNLPIQGDSWRPYLTYEPVTGKIFVATSHDDFMTAVISPRRLGERIDSIVRIRVSDDEAY